MNRSYKTVFNRSLGVWQAVSELAKGRGKASRSAANAASLPDRRPLVQALGGAILLMAAAAPAAQAATYLWISGDLTVNAGSSITGFSSGVSASGSLGTLTNNGTISGSMTFGVINQGSINRVFNNGVISGPSIGFLNKGLSTIGTLINSGTISGAHNVENRGSIGTLVDAGSVTSSGANVTIASGIVASPSLGVYNYTGTIGTAIEAGIYNAVSITGITNSGTITSGSGLAITNASGGSVGSQRYAGIYNDAAGTIGTLANNGLITSGSGYGVWNSGAVTLIQNNSGGTISGAATALYNAAGGTIGTIANSGVISGNIVNLSANALTISGGAGAAVGTLTGVGGAAGTITNTLSNLVFSSGNELLNDQVALGSNSLVKNGTGTLTVTAGQTYAGATTIMGGGTLALSGAGSLAASSGVTDNGTFDISGTAGTSIKSLSGTGAVTLGAQTLTLTNASGSFSGAISGTGGLTLASGTQTLTGGNTWGGNTTISSGTLTLGSYSQASGQTLGIGASSAAAYGKLAVTGTATFNAGANLAVDVAGVNTLAVGQTLAGVVTAGTLSASTFNVTDNSALFNFKALVSGNAVNLNVVSNSSSGIYDAVKAYGLTPALGSAQVLDAQVNGSPSGDMNNVVTAFGQLPDQGSVARAAAQTLPVNSGSQAILGALSSINHIVSDRMAPGATGLSTGDAMANRHVWVKPFGSHASQSDEGGASGFSANTWGLAVGAEGDWDTTRLGLAYAYANTRVNGNTALSGTGADAQLNSNVLAFYGSRPVDGLMLDFQADTGWNDNSSQRGLSFGNLHRTASGSYGTWSAHVGTGLSKTLPLSPDVAFVPGVRIDYTRLQSQSYSESGAGALNLNVNANTVQSLVLGADACLVGKIGERGKLGAHVGAGYDTINDPGNIVAAYAGAPGQSFVAAGLRHSPWLMTAGLGYDYRTERGANISLRYDVQGRSGFVNQSASLNVSWAF